MCCRTYLDIEEVIRLLEALQTPKRGNSSEAGLYMIGGESIGAGLHDLRLGEAGEGAVCRLRLLALTCKV